VATHVRPLRGAAPPPAPLRPLATLGALALRSVWAVSRRGLAAVAPPLLGHRSVGWGLSCAAARFHILARRPCARNPSFVWPRWCPSGWSCRSRPASALPLSGSCAPCAAGRAIRPLPTVGESGCGLRPLFFSACAWCLRVASGGVSPRSQPREVCRPHPRPDCPSDRDLLRGLMPPAPPSILLQAHSGALPP